MSWQRILESARKHGHPIIVTDIAGREPMVVMPFDEFEVMNEAYLASLESWEEDINDNDIEYSELEAPVSEVPVTPLESFQREPIVQEVDPSKSSGRAESVLESSQQDDISHLSMEDRFYLEPVEDEGQ